LTIVAVGTSLPELASSVAAARRGEHDMALGNVLGSNMFNTLAVVGISGLIKPYAVDADILSRDMPVMLVLTLSLFLFGFGFRGRQGRINRFEGVVLLVLYSGYLAWLVRAAVGAAG
jgi:cation:H+ antiporter